MIMLSGTSLGFDHNHQTVVATVGSGAREAQPLTEENQALHTFEVLGCEFH